jgi:hypothetical protein
MPALSTKSYKVYTCPWGDSSVQWYIYLCTPGRAAFGSTARYGASRLNSQLMSDRMTDLIMQGRYPKPGKGMEGLLTG